LGRFGQIRPLYERLKQADQMGRLTGKLPISQETLVYALSLEAGFKINPTKFFGLRGLGLWKNTIFIPVKNLIRRG